MPAWWPNKLKHKELNQYYHDYTWEKTTYNTFINRVIRCKIPKEKAIKKWMIKRKPKTVIKSDWRVCTQCLQYKYWSYFARDKSNKHWRTVDCLECRNKRHREIRKKPEYKIKENDYKKQSRQTEIGKLQTKSYNLYYKHFGHNRSILKKIWELPKRSEIPKIKKQIIKNLWLENEFSLLWNTNNS